MRANCMFCGFKRKEDVLVRDVNVKEPIEVCEGCYYDFVYEDYWNLTRKLEKRFRGQKQKPLKKYKNPWKKWELGRCERCGDYCVNKFLDKYSNVGFLWRSTNHEKVICTRCDSGESKGKVPLKPEVKPEKVKPVKKVACAKCIKKYRLDSDLIGEAKDKCYWCRAVVGVIK